jgi:hypothetical protein
LSVLRARDHGQQLLIDAPNLELHPGDFVLRQFCLQGGEECQLLVAEFLDQDVLPPNFDPDIPLLNPLPGE